MKKLILLLLVALAGCSSGSTVSNNDNGGSGNVEESPAPSSEPLNPVQKNIRPFYPIALRVQCENCTTNAWREAIMVWNEAVGEEILIDRENPEIRVIVTEDFNYTNGSDGNVICQDFECVIHIRPEFENLLALFAHEYGHALGFEHVADEASVMHPDCSNAFEITPVIVEQMKGLLSAFTDSGCAYFDDHHLECPNPIPDLGDVVTD